MGVFPSRVTQSWTSQENGVVDLGEALEERHEGVC